MQENINDQEMTVGDLIKDLQQYNPNFKVRIVISESYGIVVDPFKCIDTTVDNSKEDPIVQIEVV